MSRDDTDMIPEALTAPWLKRFFKCKFGIPVRATNVGSKSWVQVWIQSDRGSKKSLHFLYEFPPELGNRCMRIVYAGSEQLREQNWGGNIQPHSISLHSRELRQLLQGLLDLPVEPLTESSHRDALVAIEKLMDCDPEKNTPESTRLEALVALVKEYKAE